MLFVISVAVFYGVIGENSHIAVQDNLDLFTAQFAMLKNTGTFFGSGHAAPFLGGVSRDVLPSEFSLISVLYMILPSFWAYVAAYLCKVIIAVYSMRLLIMDIVMGLSERDNNASLKDAFFPDYVSAIDFNPQLDGMEFMHLRNYAYLAGLLYGVLNMFPAFGICFSSIPLIIFILRRIYFLGKKKNNKEVAADTEGTDTGLFRMAPWFLLVFLYPFLSYFSYFGLFILGYLCIAIIWLWIKDRKLPLTLLISLPVLGLGYAAFEYRLFYMMLFSDTETIRDTMVQTYLGASDIMAQIWDVFKNGMMHVEDVHRNFVLPVCVIYFIYRNVRYIKEVNIRGIFTDIFNLCALILLFNSVVYGLYFSKTVNVLIETILPPLKGFQFNRTVFFSPFIWAAMMFIVCYRMMMWGMKLAKKPSRKSPEKKSDDETFGTFAVIAPYFILLFAIFVVLRTPTRYNDLYSTALATYKNINHSGYVDELGFGEFYSQILFDKIKEDIGYSEDEWAVAYGMHPAILEYNGISTLDGYLGFYPREYKDRFRRVIAPALDRKENTRIYFDEWGARCYLYSGTDDSIVMATRSYEGVTDRDIYIDADALRDMGGRYIFSRIDISNAKDMGMNLVGTYEDESSPYVIYVYVL